MSTQVNVLCPNGRRQQVKTTPNLKILDIVEEVCKKQGYEANEYDLIHQRRPLDVTLTLRLAGVPNNAQLELRKCEGGPRKFDDITIALQLEDGSRLPPNAFKPGATSLRAMLDASRKDSAELSRVLDEPGDSGVYPTVTYLNEQIVGLYQLENTTLKDLGLTNGRVIVRFSLKALDKETFDRANQEFQQKLEKKAKLETIFKQKQQEELEDQKRQAAAAAAAYVPSEQPVEQPSTSQNQPDYGVTRRPRQELDFIPQEEPRRAQVKKAPVVVESQFGEAAINPPGEFANFKFPEETKGQTLNDQNELAEIEKLSKEPCDRQGILFNSERAKVDEQRSQDEPMSTDLPDEFFEVNVGDLQNMLGDLKRTQNEDAPLMTKRLRELEQDKRAMKYSQVAVRVAFKEGLMLQGLFRPKERISTLYDFVRGALSVENSAEDLDFHLYITPPKKVLSDTKKTLFEEHLYPASIVYFKNQSDKTPVFKEPGLRSVDEADELVHKFVHSAMRNVESEGMDALIKQERVVSSLLHSSGLVGAGSSGRQQNAPTHPASGGVGGSDVNKKLSKFLGKK